MAPRWLTPDEDAMWRGFLTMSQVIEAATEAQLREHGLSPADYGVLVVLSEATAPLRVGELGDRGGWESSRLAHQLRRMEKRGLVCRTGCPSDRRGTFVELTPAGRSAIEAAAPGHAAAVRDVFVDVVRPEELEMLRTLAERVASRASARPGSPSAPLSAH
ncbi:MAG: MarR family transcriptional regulator [Dermatophilaceae bacterium]|jgi:DNA-binding MarR family transcriptional regulator